MSFLQAKGFSATHSYKHSEYPTQVSAPPTYPSPAYGVPRASVVTKFVNPLANDSVRAKARLVPFSAGYEKNYACGLPLLTNSRRISIKSDACIAATPAVINYLLEEAARRMFAVNNTLRKRKVGDLLEPFQTADHLYITELSAFLNTWHWFGVIEAIDKNDSRSTSQEIMVNCDIQKCSFVRNYWGNVKDGDRLFWSIGMKKNVNQFFSDPSGNDVGKSIESPDSFLQMIPVSHGASVPAHMTNYLDLDTLNRNDTDFMRHVVVKQKDFKINMQTGKSHVSEIDLSTQHIKSKDLITERHEFGALFYVGTVKRGPRRTQSYNSHDLNQALRNDLKAQRLDMIEVFLGH